MCLFNKIKFAECLLQFKSQNEVNLVAHCYFEHQKFLWGMLDKSTNIKYKIEIMWQDISAIRIVDEENKPGILEIEVCIYFSFS